MKKANTPKTSDITITSKEFFSNKKVVSYIRDSITMLTKRYNYKIHVGFNIDMNNEAVAYTDQKSITINPMNSFFTKNPKITNLNEHFTAVLGVCAHEIGHIMFTDAPAFYEKAMEIRKAGLTITSSDPNLVDMNLTCDTEEKKSILANIFHSVENILEDGYIEQEFMKYYAGEMGQALYWTREVQFLTMNSLSKVDEDYKKAEERNLQFNVISNALLCYAKYGRFLVDSLTELQHSIVSNRVAPIMNIVDEYMEVSTNSARRNDIIQLVMIHFWPEIKAYMTEAEKQMKMQKMMADMIKKMSPEQLKELMDKLDNGESSSSMGGMPIPMPNLSSTSAPQHTDNADVNENAEESNSESSDSRSKEAEKTKSAMGKSAASADEKTSENDSKNNDETSNSSESESWDDSNTQKLNTKKRGASSGSSTPVKHHTTSPSEEKRQAEDSSESPGAIIQDVISSEGARIDNTSVRGKVSKDGDGDVVFHDCEDSGYKNRAVDVSNLVADMKREKASVMEAERLSKSEQDRADALKLEGIHNNVTFHVNRITTVDEKMVDDYKSVAAPLLKISRKLAKEVSQKLKDHQEGGKIRHLNCGNRIALEESYRRDGRCFLKNREPDDIPPIAIGILLDESGSMCCGNRATSARATAIILEDFARQLQLPCYIMGHSANQNGRRSVEMYSYVTPESRDNKDKYRLMDISARANNRDGAALKYIGSCLADRPEPVKILIVVSDGQPAADGYYGATADEDVYQVKKSLQRKGIVVFSAAIGSDKENIKRIYKDGFLDITSLDDMPRILGNLILKFIKV